MKTKKEFLEVIARLQDIQSCIHYEFTVNDIGYYTTVNVKHNDSIISQVVLEKLIVDFNDNLNCMDIKKENEFELVYKF